MSDVLTDHDGGVVVVTLDRPDRRNALDPTFLVELHRLFDDIAGDPDVRAVVCHAGESSSCPHARLGGMIARTAVGRGDRWEGGMPGMLAIHYTAAIIVALVILLALAGYAIWYLFVKMGK